MDGHRGIKNEEVNKATIPNGNFSLVLSALYDDPDAIHFIIHATSSSLGISGGMHPLGFLSRIGYQQYPGLCQFHRERCFWLRLATLRTEPFRDPWQVQRIHEAFTSHVQKLPTLYENYKKILNNIGLPNAENLDLFPELRDFEAPLLKPDPNAIPDWVTSAMPPRFIEVHDTIRRLQEEAASLALIAGLLWETGENLERAVCGVFSSLGYDPRLTRKGRTYDITVTLDENRRLLIEVTGIEGAIKKNSNKINQALQTVQQEQGEADRVVIAANAHRLIPLAERTSVEIVTEDALALIAGMKVNLVTTATLFQIWRISLDDPGQAKTIVDKLHSQAGGLFIL